MAGLILPTNNPAIIQSAAPPLTLRLERKHPLAIRWMHWINFPVLFIMILSGIRIYWNDSDNAHLHPHAVYRIGFGSFTLLRIFPDSVWNALHIPWHVTEGMGDHFFFMWIFAINGIAYAAFLLISGEWRFLVPQRQAKYNAAQRIAYSTVILMGLGSLLTGLAIYKPTQAHYLTALLGGYEWARWEHFWLTIGFCLFFLVHVAQVALAGWNTFRGMVSGLEIRPVTEPSLEEERKRWR
jgi:thiosulfate reductase cytochrome b subunit